MLIGIIGSVVPVVPGPILSFAGLVLYYFFQKNQIVSGWAILLFAFGMAILTVCEYALPILGARISGASKKGQWGAIVGAVIGLIAFPPLGIFIGAVLGAVIGETQDGKKIAEAIKAAIGVVLGGVVSTFLQIIFSLSVLVYFLIKVV